MMKKISFTPVSHGELIKTLSERGIFKSAIGFPSVDAVDVRENIGSTSSALVDELRSGGERRLIAARSQSMGRGRLGRSFESDFGGIYFSFSVPVSVPLDTAYAGSAADLTCGLPRSLITPAAGVAAASAIRSLYGFDVKIKWVNDLIAAGKKLCGILTESISGDNGEAYVVGIGINAVNTHFPENCTSISENIECGDINANAVIAAVIDEFVKRLPHICSGSVLSEYESLLCMLNTPLRVHTFGRGDFDAVATGLTRDGALITERVENGKTVTEALSSGEVSVRIIKNK